MGYNPQLSEIAVIQNGTDITQLLDWMIAYQQEMMAD
jgi:hypothetical protein